MTLLLSPVQARVVAALVEKSISTPQYYPLSVNALVAACNQKNAREPVMSLSEGEVGSTLISLEELRLVKRDDQGSRVPKWRHRFNHELLLKEPGQALIVALILRGPQTLSELRANAAPLGGPAEVAGVQALIADLGDRAQPLVTPLARQAGQAAQRYAQLLCGPPSEATAEAEPYGSAAAAAPRGVNIAALIERIEALEARVQALETSLS